MIKAILWDNDGVLVETEQLYFEATHGLLKYFDFVLTADDCRHTKPDPDPCLRAIEKTGVGCEACVAVEDSERGLESATRAGIRCIVVPSALTRGSRFPGAHRILGSVSEIPMVL